MIKLSVGYFTGEPFLLPVTPINKDMIPTRPRNMAIASNIFDDDDSKGVMPSDDPTVNSADRVSKRRLLAGS